MKRHDAFAFANFDAAKILQRPYFWQWRKEWLSVKNEWSDAELLEHFAVDYSDSATMQVVMQQALDWFDDGLALMKKYRRRIKKHIDCLIQHRDSVANQIAVADETSTADITNLRGCHKRTANLAERYADCLAATDDLEKKIHARYREFEDEINHNYRQTFGKRLRQARLEKGLTQTQLGDSVSLSQKTISGYEKGLREPNLAQMVRFAYKLNRPVGWFLDAETPFGR